MIFIILVNVNNIFIIVNLNFHIFFASMGKIVCNNLKYIDISTSFKPFSAKLEKGRKNMQKIAYQGVAGAYSHIACLELFPNQEYIACEFNSEGIKQ